MWLNGLNPEQQEAALHNRGPLLILAGAGSGKTTVLVSRTGRLITEKVAAPQEILVLTFTNKAARELRHRVAAKLGPQGSKIWAGTFHSFGLYLLKKYAGMKNIVVFDSADAQSVVKELMRDIKIAGKDKFDVDRLVNLINQFRGGEKFNNQTWDEYFHLAHRLYPDYERKLKAYGAVDFEGLLLDPLNLLKNNPETRDKIRNDFQQIMVDEFQDTNKLQMELIEQILGPHQNITVVGDDDQSIYGWRGAEVKNILQFPRNFKNCKVVKLERNYRSLAPIINLANHVIAENKTRHGKVLIPHSSEEALRPELFCLETEDEEADFVVQEIRHFLQQGLKLGDIAVLYRSNTQGGLIESCLKRNNIQYSISGGTSIFERKEVKDMMAYLKLSLRMDDVSLKRIFNTPSRGLGDTSLEKLVQFAESQKISFYQACKRWEEAGLQSKAGTSLETLLEFLKGIADHIINPAFAGTPGEKFVQLIRDLGYRDFVYQTSSEPSQGEKKWLLVEVFGRILDSYIAKRALEKSVLQDFIEAMTLRDDDSDAEEAEKVQLMTLHASKGLEFPAVILVGVEEDLLPHRTLGADVDEERRLFYVGVTRAEKHLVLSYCKSRKRHGQLRPVARSRFIMNLPPELIHEHPKGFRGVTGAAREDLVSGFLSQLQGKLAPPKP
jgi:DNA helicase-2/ATP-dependent DNA helicase PcrA